MLNIAPATYFFQFQVIPTVKTLIMTIRKSDVYLILRDQIYTRCIQQISGQVSLVYYD